MPNILSRPADTDVVPVHVLRPADSPRVGGLDEAHVRVLAEAGADQWPPILVDRASMRVVDGMHRLAAAQLIGRTRIRVQYYDGPPERAFLEAVQLNVAHGLPLSLADRRAAAERIIAGGSQLSDRSIGRIVGLTPRTVAGIRRAAPEHPASGARIGRDGRCRPMDNTEGRRIAGRLVRNKPNASLREIAREAGISLGTAQNVRQRVLAGEDPVPEGLRRRATVRHRDRPAAVSAHVTAHPAGDLHLLLASLRQDPALRYTESGRSLLRWLNTRTLTPSEVSELADGVPAHCAVNVGRLARSCAQAWLDFAQVIEQAAEEPAAG